MARNEEKQQGRLNRLWLQKERDEGRLKDVHERRPKLNTLHSASSVKKWIPSIKNEIEYYLQQSQLTHYPERKITEFQLKIEGLEKEYKSFNAKLRVLDPSCKHKAWTPRAYSKRRAETQTVDPTKDKCPRLCEPRDACKPQTQDMSHSTCRSSLAEGAQRCSANGSQTLVSTSRGVQTSEIISSGQHLPLSFDRTRLAVAAAACRGPAAQLASARTQNLAQILQSALPNLSHWSTRKSNSVTTEDTERMNRATQSRADRQSGLEMKDVEEEAGGEAGGKESTETREETSGHVLGLGCYSSSDEDCST